MKKSLSNINWIEVILHKAGYYKCNIFVVLYIRKENVLKLFYLIFYNKGNAEDWRNNAGIFWKTHLRIDAETGALYAKKLIFRKPGKQGERKTFREIYNFYHCESEYMT